MISNKLSVSRRLLSLVLVALPLSAAYAQQDSTLNRTVVVENLYNPALMDASKINVLPQIEEPAVVKTGIEYATALRPVSAWNYQEMPPIVRTWPAAKARRGYLSGGYGNRGNVDFKAGYIGDITSHDRLQADVSLTGWNGTLENRLGEDWKSRSYTTTLKAAYEHRFGSMTLDLGGGFRSQVFNYMPAPNTDILYQSSEGGNLGMTDKQHHTQGDFHIGLASHKETAPLQFRLETGLRYFGIKYAPESDGGKEKEVHTEGDVWGRLNNGRRIGIDFRMDNLFYSSDTLMSNYTSLCLNPYYALESDDWRVRIGAHVDWQSGDDGGVDVAPDVKVEYIFSDSYVLYAHALGGRELNDYRRLSAFSPYMAIDGRPVSTYVPLNATLGLKASPANGLWFHLFGGYRISRDELFCNLAAGREFWYTGLSQDDAETAYGGAELKYGYKDWFDATLKGVFYSWSTDEEVLLASKPKFELNFHAEAKVFEGLKINVGYDYVQRKDYTFRGHGGELYDAGLGNISHLSAGASYEFLEGLSVFGQVNNLLNKHYYFESGYPAQQLNVLAGLALRF